MVSVAYLVAQTLGTIAFIFQVYSAQSRDRTTLTLFLGVSNFLWMAHYIVLGFPLAAMIAALVGCQLIVSSVVDPKYRRPIIIASIILYWIAAALTFDDYLHLLPALGSSVFSLSLLFSRSLTQLLPAVGTSVLSLSLLSQNSVKVVRIGAMFSFAMWMAHGFVTGSIVEIAANGIPLAAAIYGLILYDFGLKRLLWPRSTQASDRQIKPED